MALGQLAREVVQIGLDALPHGGPGDRLLRARQGVRVEAMTDFREGGVGVPHLRRPPSTPLLGPFD